jgi:Xaa-Pro aminopeptidase
VTVDRRPARQSGVRAWLREHDLDALLVTHLPNIRYLTGFSGSAGVLLVGHDETVLVTDFRYAVQAPLEVEGSASVRVESANVWDRVTTLVEAFATVGIESAVMPVRDAQRLGEATSARLVPTHGVVELGRAVKSPEELAAIGAAARLAEDALDDVVSTVAVGDEERDIAGRLEAALRRRGSEGHPFEVIVASGPRSALPHAGTTGRQVARGELLLVDFGARVDGYCADVTRTFVVGAVPDEQQRTMYGLVRSAQVRAIDGIEAGMEGKAADALARDLIAARGFGDAFGHSLGHGLGLEVHEAPRLGPREGRPVPEGAVVTVEPGVYLPGWGGVRIEDDIHVGPGGVERLSGGPSDIVTLG